MPIISIKNASFSFGNNLVVENISFDISKGDFLGIVGPNGSGKTTLLKMILGLHPLRSGDIRINGKSIRVFDDWNKIGYVPQKATNINEAFPATVREIVQTGLLSSKKFPKRYSSNDSEKIVEALQEVGMKEYSSKRIGELSGGQQQRVLIARAIVSNPEILLLDEPTTGVDQKTQQKFYDLLGELNSKGLTIILISHDIGRITNYVNKIASLNRKLEFYGTHEEFCKHPVGEHDHHCLELKRG
jgi:zinc transport system ATP-binding protein